ncbi:hypothetical protein ABK040_005549 [Willaertia magna]
MSINDKTRLCKVEDIAHFDIHFEALLDNEEAFHCFTQFLTKSFNKESATFLIHVNEYRKIKYERTRLQKANEIYQQFVEEGSKNQLNLNASLRHQIANTLKEWNEQSKKDNKNAISSLSTTPIKPTTSNISNNSSSNNNNNDECSENTNSENSTNSSNLSSLNNSSSNNPYYRNVAIDKTLFDQIEMKILCSLKENQFSNFINHEIFKNYITKKPLQLLYDIGIPKVTSSDFSFLENINEYLKNIYVTKNDLLFLKSKIIVSEEDRLKEWELIGESRNHKCYISKNKFDVGDSTGLHFLLFEVNFPGYSPKQLINTLLDVEYRYSYDPNCKKLNTFHYTPKSLSDNTTSENDNKQQYATSVYQELLKFPWPFNNREFVYRASLVYDKIDDFYLLSQLSIHEDNNQIPKPINDNVRALSVGGWSFQAIDPITKRVIPSGPDRPHTKDFYLKKENSEDIHLVDTKYCQVFYLDMKGKFPRPLVNTLWKSRAKAFQKVGLKYLGLNEKRGFICNENCDVLKTLEENGIVELKL